MHGSTSDKELIPNLIRDRSIYRLKSQSINRPKVNTHLCVSLRTDKKSKPRIFSRKRLGLVSDDSPVFSNDWVVIGAVLGVKDGIRCSKQRIPFTNKQKVYRKL